jgi:DNA polymerase III alpha subunit (gram-positive type)
MKQDNNLYIVVDIEADGPVAGLYSMLSIGAVATTDEKEISSFYRTIQPLEGAKQDPLTMGWWRTQPQAWKEVTRHPQPAAVVLKEFAEWVKEFGVRPTFVAHPIAFDYAVVTWYLWKFTGGSPFDDEHGSALTLDIRSYIAGKFNLPLSKAKRTYLPDWMTEGMPEHSHNAMDDARGYGVILRNVLQKSQ